MKTVERDVLPVWTKEAEDLKAAFDEHAIVAIMDARGAITFVNEQFCVITRFVAEELAGRDYRIICIESYPNELFHEIERCKAGDARWRGEIQLRAKDGARIWISATIVPILDELGALRQFVVVGADITEQRRVKGELEEMQRLQQLLADLSSRFVAVPSGQVDAAIATTQRLVVEALGLDRSILWQVTEHGSDMVLTHCWQRDGSASLPPDSSISEEGAMIYAQLMRGETVCSSEAGDLPAEAASNAMIFSKYEAKSCLTFPLMVNGRVFGALAFAAVDAERGWRDDVVAELKLVAQIIGNVVARQRAESREEQLRDQLAHAMRIASLGELSATMAHELNQPLAAILSNAQAAQRFLAGGEVDLDELRAILADIVRDDKRAGNVIHNLQAMMRKHPTKREACSLNELVAEVLELLRSEMIGERVELQLSLAGELPAVEVARVEMQQVLVNLLLNAVHAMQGNAPGTRVIELETLVEEGAVLVRVRDRGIGIPLDRMERIFDPFFSTKSAGLGMGLSICRRIVERHGGRIGASNREDGGAVFSFALPVAIAVVR